MSGFTKGPWRVYERPMQLNSGFINVEADSRQIYGTETYRASHNEHLANAHLIAAAPDLYEALQTAYALGFLEPSHDSGVSHRDFCKAAKSALAKARGES